MGAILLLLGGTSYVLWRLMSRELAVARLQTEFVSAVSHEFRTPLTSIRHVTELLDENDTLAPDERKAFYGALARNTDRLQRFVESLLDFSRLEAGRRPYEPVPMDAGEFVADVVGEFQREMTPRRVGVQLERDPGALPLRADRTSLANALWNLLDNAVKYSPSSTRVVVSVRAQGDGVAIAVQDEGLGIPAGEQRDIFKRFVRGRAATRLRIRGTGLGLAIVSHVVSAHGGTIGVESIEGAGSTFTLVLPRASGAVGQPADRQAGLMTANG
jgi:signal transduction histidine kinase